MERLTYRGTEQMTEDGMITPSYSDYPVRRIIERLAEYEDAEEQGLLIRLPVAIGGTCWGWEYPTRIDEEDGSTWTICDIKRAKVVPKKFNIFMLDRFGESYFETKAEAEAALAKMKGE